MPKFSLKTVQNLARERFAMDLNGIHGFSHWQRVHENGLYLCKHSEADKQVVECFAYLHDCCRLTDGADRQHGERAAEFAESVREFLCLDDCGFALLQIACRDHEKGKTSSNQTIGACWDSDRLDLGRVGIRTNTKFLSIEAAKKKSVLDWAQKRSRGIGARLKG